MINLCKDFFAISTFTLTVGSSSIFQVSPTKCMAVLQVSLVVAFRQTGKENLFKRRKKEKKYDQQNILAPVESQTFELGLRKKNEREREKREILLFHYSVRKLNVSNLDKKKE